MLGYVKEATDLGILKGYPDGSFGPKKTATRAEAVVIVSRVISEMTKGLEKALITVIFQNSSSRQWLEKLKFFRFHEFLFYPETVILLACNLRFFMVS